MYNIPSNLVPLNWYKAIAIACSFSGILIDYKSGYVVFIPQTDQWIGEVGEV